MTETPKPGAKKAQTMIETIEVAGTQVLDEIKALIQQGNIRRLHLRAKDSDFHLEVPMTVGVLVGGAVVLAAPWLAILGVIGGLISKVSIEIERETPKTGAAAPPAPTPKTGPAKGKARPAAKPGKAKAG